MSICGYHRPVIYFIFVSYAYLLAARELHVYIQMRACVFFKGILFVGRLCCVMHRPI